MPLNREAYTRYRLIDARLRRKPNPTFNDLMEYVSEQLDKPVSKRTLQLDLQEMRYNQALNFNAPIEYDKYGKAYFYADEHYSINNLPVTADELHGLDFAISILHQFKHLPAIREFEDAIMKIASTVQINKEVRGEADYIQLDKPYRIKGLEFVEPILKAISDRRVLQFNYQKHGSESNDQTLLEPYLIKESKNFWYVIGRRINKQEKKILTFALDRISEMRITEVVFEEVRLDKKNFFSNVVGVTIGEGNPERVVLRFSELQGRYIKTVPIHHSQKIIRDKNGFLEVELQVVINTELKMQLLSYGATVKVLKPKLLADEVNKTAKQVIAQYKK
ncbi:MAG: WYL domain-containing protein [Chitinophagales bacterium]|nr:WYL domain-containing protein [Chitinophagales bacterium]